MKNIGVLAALVFALAASPLAAKERSYSNRYQQWGERNQRSGLFEDLQKKPLTETTLLLQLDKEGRQKFRNLPRQARVEVLEKINQTGTKDYESVISEVMEEQNLQVERSQERMLHNGMDRIQR